MRLEDWQKWLDTQFLKPEQVKPPEAVSEPQADSEASVPAQRPVDAVIAVVTAPTPTQSASHGGMRPAPSVPAVAQREPTAPPPQAPIVQEQSHVAVGERDRMTHVEEVEVPSIERYLPFLRRTSPAASDAREQTAPTEVTEPTIEAAPASPDAAPAPAAEAGEAADLEGDGPAANVPAVQVGEPAAAASPRSGQNGGHTPVPVRRYEVTYRRARAVRAVDLDAAAAQLEDGALWKLVPRHIQSLVAMGGEDVAQNSYKRAFRESRMELITRLLDPALSLEETARLLNVCPTTVRRYTNRGLLRHQRTAGDQRRFRLSDVLAFLEAQSRPGREDSHAAEH